LIQDDLIEAFLMIRLYRGVNAAALSSLNRVGGSLAADNAGHPA
jgi:hypothetical protein